MDAEYRRAVIIEVLESSTQPISGTDLAKKLSVSRQIIVQDIALLRAVNKNILSTNKGYLLFHNPQKENRPKRTMRMCHDTDRILEELYSIVDLGGKVLDVVVEHEIYGQIMVDLIIRTRRDADEFVKKVMTYQTKPLNALTGGMHYHTLEADTEEILNEIEETLRSKNILA